MIWFDEIGSTNDEAMKRAREGAPEGFIVAAGFQTAGRGRLGRLWQSPRDVGIYFSIVLRPPAEMMTLIPLMVGVALAEAIEGSASCPYDAQRHGDVTRYPTIGVKWPNDVLINGKKISGILAEAEWKGNEAIVVVGVGVNVTTALKDLPVRALYPASSILVETGITLDRKTLLERWKEKFDILYADMKTHGTASFAQRWSTWDTLKGHPVRIHTQAGWGEGVGDGIDNDGALFVQRHDGERVRVLAGDVMPL